MIIVNGPLSGNDIHVEMVEKLRLKNNECSEPIAVSIRMSSSVLCFLEIEKAQCPYNIVDPNFIYNSPVDYHTVSRGFTTFCMSCGGFTTFCMSLYSIQHPN